VEAAEKERERAAADIGRLAQKEIDKLAKKVHGPRYQTILPKKKGARAMRVVITTVVEIPDSQMNVNGVEKIITQGWRQFPTQAWNAVAHALEQGAEADYGGALKRKGRERRWFWTTAGLVHLERQRYCHAAEPHSFLLFDGRVGLSARVSVTPAAQRLFAQCAARGPSFGQVCQQLAMFYSQAPAPGTLWKWTQAEGAYWQKLADTQTKAFFCDGELPGGNLPPKSFVAVEADSTMVHAWRKKGHSHELYLGVAYDGKCKAGRRRKLTGKMAVASAAGAAEFGRELFVSVQAQHNVCEAQTVLYLSDGAPALETIRDELFPMAKHQLDHAHVVRKTREAYGYEHSRSADKTLALIFGQKQWRLERLLNLHQRCFPQQSGALNELKHYVLDHWEWLFAARRLKQQGQKLPPHVSGSGVIERNVGVYIGQRMKHRGMGWTKRGASNILRVRLNTLLQAS